ncbi:30S ribosomal protein S16 [Bienertia sinuspersici]
MMRGFKLFSSTTGLEASKEKIEVFSCGMPFGEIRRILDLTGFVKGKFPFKYLGIHICAKRIRRWCNLVWDRKSMPKHRFISWLAIHDKLYTRDRLRKFHIIDSNLFTWMGVNFRLQSLRY